VPLLFGGEDDGDGGGVGRRRPALWPLTYLMDFRSGDHLKNGEGLLIGDDGDGDGGLSDGKDNSLSARIRRLVSERTDGICCPSSDQKIFLLTHLCYFGYCFNPVSFYYLLKKERNVDGGTTIEAIVAEVSNTPWNEMKCYVLHPNSRDIDIVRVIDGTGPSKQRASSPSSSREGILSPSRHATMEDDEGVISTTTTTTTTAEEGYNAATSGSSTTTTAAGKDDNRIDHNNNNNSNSSINYIFNKTFHVSPFMELDYIYDWTFWNPTKSRIRVSANMIKKQTKVDDNDNTTISNTTPNNIHHKNNKKHFNAYFDIHRQNFTPLHLGYQLFRLPVYCFIIQVWIHIEAFRLLLKGVVFIPHPEGAETMVSKVIAKVMAPVFELMDWMSNCGGDSVDTLVGGDETKCGDVKSQ